MAKRPLDAATVRACAGWAVLLVCSVVACGGGGGAAQTPGATEPALSVQEQQCLQAGWQREPLSAAGQPRGVLWKAPANGAWSAGSIVVMHGGGGQHTNFCVANVELIAPQVRFTQAALEQGYAVFLLDSTDAVTDNAGRRCGKVWDDEVRARANLDLPYIEEVLRRLIPARRPAGARSEIFLGGHSSGGYMAVRAASNFGHLLSGVALVASGDPYGWFRDCSTRPTDRPNVFGIGLDSETLRPIGEPAACASPSRANEKPWEGTAIAPKPPFRAFHHAQDGIHDRSCVDKVRAELVARGYPETPAFTLDGGSRSTDVHYWLDAYNAPLLAWFGALSRR